VRASVTLNTTMSNVGAGFALARRSNNHFIYALTRFALAALAVLTTVQLVRSEKLNVYRW
jgi:cytochrome oxidase assembly protein ShyY1